MKKFFYTFSALLFLFTILVVNITTVGAYETKAQVENVTSNSYNYENFIRLYVDGNSFDEGVEIDIVIIVTLSNEIQDIVFEGNGFLLTKDFKDIDGDIHFSVINDSTVEAPFLNIGVTLDNGEVLTANLFGFVREGKIYVDPYAYFFAERAYLLYTNNLSAELEPTEGNTIIPYDAITPINGIEESEVTSSTSTPDTTITGSLFWTDINENPQPLRFTKIKVFKDALILTTCIYEGYTDENGEFSISFSSDLLNGSQKIAIKVFAQGTDIAVRDAYGFLYKYRIDSSNDGTLGLDSITVGENNLGSYRFDANDMTEASDAYFCRAIEIAQSAICASTYYEEMKGSDVDDVNLIYPHKESSNSSFYRNSEKRIYILEAGTVLPSYASCDVITHEYGHHVSSSEDLTNNPGNWHIINADMAEHYKDHYEGASVNCSNDCALKKGSLSNNEFGENECKYKGCALAWGEGYATFFGELAQQYFSEKYIDIVVAPYLIPEFADAFYNAYNFNPGSSVSVENINWFRNDSCELVVTQVLYDIYDGASAETFDNLAMSHQALWNNVVGSKAKTLFEFIEYFNCYASPPNVTQLGEVLHGHRLATSAPTLSSITAEAPTVEFVWIEPNSSGFYNARKFQVNFYNGFYDLIGSTSPQTLTFDSFNRGRINIGEDLWQSVIERDNVFYISITVYEYDGDINNTEYGHYITYYESAYTLYSVMDIYSVLINGSTSLKTIGLGEYIWYKFTAPSAEEYVFETTGETGTYGELFSGLAVGRTTANRLTYDNNSGSNNNFRIVYNLSEGQTVYIRVSGDDWVETGTYLLSISSTNHTHDYTYHYEKYNSSYHVSYCSCGDDILSKHEFIKIPTGNSCKYCGYLVKHLPVTPITGLTNGNDDDIYAIPIREDEQIH